MIVLEQGRWSSAASSFWVRERIYWHHWWTPFVRISRRYGSLKEAFWIWLAWLLPPDLVKWCHVRVGAHATQPPYGDTVVPELTQLNAAKRWMEDKCC